MWRLVVQSSDSSRILSVSAELSASPSSPEGSPAGLSVGASPSSGAAGARRSRARRTASVSAGNRRRASGEEEEEKEKKRKRVSGPAEGGRAHSTGCGSLTEFGGHVALLCVGGLQALVELSAMLRGAAGSEEMPGVRRGLSFYMVVGLKEFPSIPPCNRRGMKVCVKHPVRGGWQDVLISKMTI